MTPSMLFGESFLVDVRHTPVAQPEKRDVAAGTIFFHWWPILLEFGCRSGRAPLKKWAPAGDNNKINVFRLWKPLPVPIDIWTRGPLECRNRPGKSWVLPKHCKTRWVMKVPFIQKHGSFTYCYRVWAEPNIYWIWVSTIWSCKPESRDQRMESILWLYLVAEPSEQMHKSVKACAFFFGNLGETHLFKQPSGMTVCEVV